MEENTKTAVVEFSRMRTFLYFYVASFVIFLGVIFEEFGPDLHEIDDMLFVLLALVGIILIAYNWKKRSVSSLMFTNNLCAVLAFLLVLISIYAIIVEFGDAADFGDDIPQLIIAVVMLLSRFVL